MATVEQEVQPSQSGVRRSGRVPLNKSIQVAGVNVEGRDFASTANTLMLSRHGAMIVMNQGLVPDQEVGVFNPDNARDETARIVSLIGKDKSGYVYGVEFEDPKVDFWNISFPAVESYQPEPAKLESPPESAKELKQRLVLPLLAPLLIADLQPSNLLAPATQQSRDYSILLKCPHDDYDEWMLLRDRSDPLAEIMATRWSFDCPIHGVLTEFPLIANEGTILQGASADPKRDRSFAELGSSFIPGGSENYVKVQARHHEAKRVWVRGLDALGKPFSQSTYSVNISRNGARLQGLGFLAGPGVEIELKRNWKKAAYRVVWMGQPGSRLASQIGVVCLDPGKNVWGLS